MKVLMNSFSAGTDENGNPQKLIRLEFLDVIDQSNIRTYSILWFDASYRGIPRSINDVSELYMQVSEDARLDHVQHFEIESSTYEKLKDNAIKADAMKAA